MINPYSIKRYLPMSRDSGIYFLFDDNKIIYIGVTNCLVRRIGEHACGKNWKKIKFDSFAYIIVEFKNNEERVKIEQQYIRTYKPKYNIKILKP